MKKLISIALVLVMVFAVTAVAASAADSPSGFYTIITGSEGKGSASADKDKVDAKATGSDAYVTLTATENGGYFTKWIMSGSYTTVSGDEYSDVFVIQPTSSISAIASFSEEDEYLIISGAADGEGTISITPDRVKKGSNETVTLTATPKEGNKFATWVLECEYDIVSGSLTTPTLVIRPLTDIKVTAVFTKDGKVPEKYKKSSSDTSPKTSDPAYAVVAIVLMACFAGAFAVKKIKED